MTIKAIALAAAALMLAHVNLAAAEGAIAVDDQAGNKPSDAGYGVGYGDSKDSAEADALRKCKSMGNDQCKVVVWFKKCGAYASSAEKFGIGYGDSEDIAKSTALSQCGNDSCHIVASDCTDD